MNPSTVPAIRSRSPTGSFREDEGDPLSRAAPPGQHQYYQGSTFLSPSNPSGPSMKVSSRSRHPTGQDNPGLGGDQDHGCRLDRSGSWGGVSESDEDLHVHLQQPLLTGTLEEPHTTRRRSTASGVHIPVDASGYQPINGETVADHGEQSGIPPDAEENFRRRLAFFFMDPLQKYRARKQLPWKLGLQIIKVFIVTAQLCIFGNYRYAHTKYYTDNQIAFEHLFLKGWDAVREVHAYPPATGSYAIYKKSTFYDYFDYIATTYHHLDNITVNPVFRNSSFDFCQAKFASGNVYPNLTWSIDFAGAQEQSGCISIPYERMSENFSSVAYLQERNFTIPWDTVKWMQLNFTIQTLTFTQLGPLLGPECFRFNVIVYFDNNDYDGQIPVTLDIQPRRYQCPHPSGISNPTTVTIHLLNYLVIFCCVASLILCVRALVRAQILRAQAERVFRMKFGWKLTQSEKLDFLNGWYIVICVNDVLILVGSVIKEMIETRNTYGDLWDFCSLFLGTGALLVWMGMLRYLGFFTAYNVLLLTLKGALPKCMRFLFCALLIYFGFVFCGWVILGPYHFKFETILSTSECLFSLINGDDMFATFSSTPENSSMIWYFSRIYLYTFISLFIYVILSLFIAIIMDTYEIIKQHYREGWPKERMHDYYQQANYTPESGVFRRSGGASLGARMFSRHNGGSSSNGGVNLGETAPLIQ